VGMKAFPSDIVPDVLFPIAGMGLGTDGGHYWRKPKAGIWTSLCDRRSPTVMLGHTIGSARCETCENAIEEINHAKEVLAKWMPEENG